MGLRSLLLALVSFALCAEPAFAQRFPGVSLAPTTQVREGGGATLTWGAVPDTSLVFRSGLNLIGSTAHTLSTSAGSGDKLTLALGSLTGTSGTTNVFQLTSTFAPTSGTGVFRAANIAYVVNQTGGANGNTTGLRIDTTETAVGGANSLLSMEFNNGSQILHQFRTTMAGIGGAPVTNAGVLQVATGTPEPPTFTTQLGVFHGTDAIASLRATTTDAEVVIWANSTTSRIGTTTNHPFAVRTNNTDRLTVAADGSTATFTPRVLIANGSSQSAPGLAFASDDGDGIRRIGANDWSLVNADGDVVRFKGDGSLSMAGGAAATGIASHATVRYASNRWQLSNNNGTFGNVVHTAETSAFTAAVQYGKGANVASGTNITLTQDGNVWSITGTTTINCIVSTGWQAGSIVTLLFDTSLTVTDSAACTTPNEAINLPANFSATAGDTLTLILDAATGDWRQISSSAN